MRTDLHFNSDAPSLLSLGIWVWITSVRSSRESSIGCTCYQSCEYKPIQLTFSETWSIIKVSALADDIPGLKWWGLMTLACLKSLLPRNCLKQIARRSWDGCTKEEGWGKLIFTQRLHIWSLKCLEHVLNSAFKMPRSCLFWFCFSWTAHKEQVHDAKPHKHYRRTTGQTWGKFKDLSPYCVKALK